MEEVVMKKIKEFARKECMEAFGFAGVLDSDGFVMINSGKDKDLTIKIRIKE